jgi:transcriptional regulator with XRE-family HTH domain
MRTEERTALKRLPWSTDRHVGARIRLRRNMLHVSQETLGGAIGLTFQQIQKYETGLNRVGAGRLQQIADVLDCRPGWFFEGSRGATGRNGAIAQRSDSNIAAFFADRHASRLVRDFVRLAPTVKRAIVEMIAAIAGPPDEA